MQTTVVRRFIVSCACFLITQSFSNIYRQIIHHIEAEYFSYKMISIKIRFFEYRNMKILTEFKKGMHEYHVGVGL